ncbi:MAG TPA: flagellar biosynthesis protein FlhF [Rhodanobacteraceae bacterium]|nr:flagellar biosynthesis protein FlhF [Rhodanobacteraceae bacterium]
MKIKRYTARDMRQAMQKVREDQGPDAVILSSRRSDGMVEIVAAIDYDEALVREAVEPLRGERSEARVATQPPVEPAPAKVATPEAPKPAARPQAPVVASVAALTKAPAPAKVAPIVAAAPPAPVEAAPDNAPRVSAAEARAALEASAERVRMRDEIGDLRQLLESQLSSLAWNDLDRRHPLRARVLRDLTRFGIEGDVADAIVSDLPNNISTEQSRYLPLGLISRRLRVDPAASDLAGVVALVGATGAGKTTTLAKLAARHVAQHGRQSVALIGTDDFRVGAHDQLLHYGRALGVQTFTASDSKELASLLQHLGDRDLVLIDTPGMTVRDARLPSVIDTLKSNAPKVRTTLVLPANLLPGSLEHSVQAYAPLGSRHCILTKLDETPSPGAAISIVLRHGFALEFVTDGQRVPEDIHVADARRLACRLADGSKSTQLDERVMAERFGRALLANS